MAFLILRAFVFTQQTPLGSKLNGESRSWDAVGCERIHYDQPEEDLAVHHTRWCFGYAEVWLAGQCPVRSSSVQGGPGWSDVFFPEH